MVTAFGGMFWAALFLILALIIIVAVHEYGHYIVGRLCGIHAEVFSLGFGPRLISRTDRRGTRWQIAAIPLGGYVRFLGDADAASASPDAALDALSAAERRHTMHGAPLWARSATVIAGPAFNIALTLLIFFGSILYSGVAVDGVVIGAMRPVPLVEQVLQPGDRILSLDGTATPDLRAFNAVTDRLGAVDRVTYKIERAGQTLTLDGPNPTPPLINDVALDSPALKAGLRAGDMIVRAAGQDIVTFNQLPELVEATQGKPIALTVLRDGKTFDLSLEPRRRDTQNPDGTFVTRWMIGLAGGASFDPALRSPGIAEAVGLAFEGTWFMVKTILSSLASMITGAISTCNIAGPIGIAKVVGAAASTGLQTFLQTLAGLSLSIGILNLLPIPVLDGGHLVFHVYEATMGRAPGLRALQVLMSVGLAILIALMIFALSNDLFLCR